MINGIGSSSFSQARLVFSNTQNRKTTNVEQEVNQKPKTGGRPPMGGSKPPMGGGRPSIDGKKPPMEGGRPPMEGGRPPMGGGKPSMGEGMSSQMLNVDQNEDGSWSTDELSSLLSELESKYDETLKVDELLDVEELFNLDEVMSKYDKNEDGELDKSERVLLREENGLNLKLPNRINKMKMTQSNEEDSSIQTNNASYNFFALKAINAYTSQQNTSMEMVESLFNVTI